MGKINPHSFSEIIHQRCGRKRAEVKTGPAFGVDVSIVDLPNGLSMASSSDPLSLIPPLGMEESAWLSVHLLANDMATTGLPPMYGQFVLNLPSTLSKEDFKRYWQYIHQFCDDIGIAITGGHTGFVEGQNSTISGGGTFTSIAEQGAFLTAKSAKAGDLILVTKEAALSSTAILGMSFPETIKNKLGAEIQQNATELFYQTSSLRDALSAVGNHSIESGVTAMHDVTEGGILGAIYELAYASENGALVYNDQIPIGKTQSEIAGLFSIDPRYTIGAGSMIISCKKSQADEIINRLKAKDIPCCVVGEIKERAFGLKIEENGKQSDILYPEVDPYWAAFFDALKAGWK